MRCLQSTAISLRKVADAATEAGQQEIQEKSLYQLHPGSADVPCPGLGCRKRRNSAVTGSGKNRRRFCESVSSRNSGAGTGRTDRGDALQTACGILERRPECSGSDKRCLYRITVVKTNNFNSRKDLACMRKTKIICTIGPASESEEKLRELMLAGMNVNRSYISYKNLKNDINVGKTILIDDGLIEMTVEEISYVRS